MNSDSNFDRAASIGANFIEVLMKVITMQSRDPIYRLSALRVVSVFIRDATSYLVLQNEKILFYYLNYLEKPIYDLTLVHIVRVIRVCLRSFQGIDIVYRHCKSIFLFLNNILVNGSNDSELTEESLASIRNYTQ
jgi:hypothetical protein